MVESNFKIEINQHIEAKNEPVSHSSFEFEEIELTDVIDEVSISSFMSYENLKEYAINNGLLDFQNFDKNTKLVVENFKKLDKNDETIKVNDSCFEIKIEKEFKYNTRSKIFNQKPSNLEKVCDRKDELKVNLNDDDILISKSIDACCTNPFNKDPFDCFLKKLDNVLFEKKNEISDHIFVSKISDYDDHEMMIWKPKMNIKSEISNKFNRSISSCSFSSNSTTRSTIKSPIGLNECGKDHCRLGCICESLSNLNYNNMNCSKKTSISNTSQSSKKSSHIKNSSGNGGSVIYRDHCGRIECMFECSCFRRLRSATRSSKHKNDIKDKKIDMTRNCFKSNKNRTTKIRKLEQTEKNRSSSNESNQNLSNDSAGSTSSFSSSTSSSSSTDDDDQQKQNDYELKIRKSKRVRKRKKRDSKSDKSDLKIDYNSTSKFNDCYYYYYNEKDYLKAKTKTSKPVNNTSTEKTKSSENKNEKGANPKGDNYEKIVEKFKNSKSTFLNKEIWSLIKLNTNINYDKNNSRRQLVRKTLDNQISESDSNESYCDREDFDFKINLIKTDNINDNNYDIKCVEFKKYLNKLKDKSSFEPFEHKILLKIKSNEAEKSSQNVYLISNLKVHAPKFVNDPTLVDNLIILIANTLKRFSFDDPKCWKEIEFNNENELAICLIRDLSVSENRLKKLSIQINPCQTNSNDKFYKHGKVRENLTKYERSVFDQISEILHSSSNKKTSYLTNLKFNNGSNNHHPDKLLNLKVKLKRLGSNWKENLRKKTKNSSNNLTNLSAKSLSSLDLLKPKILPRVLKNRHKATNNSKNIQNQSVSASTNATRVNLKNIDSLFENVKRSQNNNLSSNKKLERLLSFCCKSELKLMNNNFINKKHDNFSSISSNIVNLRPFSVKRDDFISLNFENKNKCYYADEIAYFNKNLLDEKTKYHNYPFYDPFKDKGLILGMYNQANSRDLVDEVCITVNDMISVVSLFSNTKQMNTNGLQAPKKIIPLSSLPNSKTLIKPNVLIINKRGINDADISKRNNLNLTLASHQNSNTNSSTDINNLPHTVIKLVSPTTFQSNQSKEILNDFELNNKPAPFKGLNTSPRILIRPKVVEIKSNPYSTISKITSKTTFVPIRPKLVDECEKKEPNLNHTIRNESMNSDNKLLDEFMKKSQKFDHSNNDDTNKSEHKSKRKQDLRPMKVSLNDKEIKTEKIDFDTEAFVEAKKPKAVKKEPEISKISHHQHLVISTSSLFKPRTTSDNSKTSAKLNADENDSNSSTKRRKNSFSSTSISSYGNKNSAEFYDDNYEEDDEDFIKDSDEYHSGNSFHSLDKTFNEYSDDENYDEDDYDIRSSNSLSFSQSELKLKRPVSNTIHSIKERQRRLSLKKLFNKLKVEMSLSINELTIVNQNQLELKESLAKNLPKSKQKVLKEAVDIIEILERNSSHLENELNSELHKNITLKQCLLRLTP